MHRSLYEDWDKRLERDLCERFEFSGKEKIARLSKGQARRVAVLCAIAHRPELLATFARSMCVPEKKSGVFTPFPVLVNLEQIPGRRMHGKNAAERTRGVESV